MDWGTAYLPLLFPPTVPLRRRLLLCRVTLGKPVEHITAIKIAHAPPGHHSVIGRPSAGGLNYPEYVIYRGEQVIPVTKLRFNQSEGCNWNVDRK